MEKETHRTAGGDPREKAADVAKTAREQSRAVLGVARRSGYGLMDEQKGAFARYASDWAKAMHTAADSLNKEGNATAGDYAHWAADNLDRFSEKLASSSTEEMTRKVTDFARERPALFMGGAILAGIALSQLFKTSREPARHYPEPEGVETGAGKIYPRPEAEYGELETRKPGSPH